MPLFSIPSSTSWGIGEIGDLDRLTRWEAKVRKAGATEWVVVNDLENNLESILHAR